MEEWKLQPHDIQEMLDADIVQVLRCLTDCEVRAQGVQTEGKVGYGVYPSDLVEYLRERHVRLTCAGRSKLNRKLAAENKEIDRRAHLQGVHRALEAQARLENLARLRQEQARLFADLARDKAA